ASGKNIVVGALNAVEQRVIDRNQDPKRGPTFAVDEREQFVGGCIVVLGATAYVCEERTFIRGWKRTCGPMQYRVQGDVMGSEIFKGEIDSATLSVLGYVAQDIS